MEDNEFVRRLEQSFGTDRNLWPDSRSQKMVEWNVRNIPSSGPETKTMMELHQELKQVEQTLQEQLALEIRTMRILDCEADVFLTRVRIERLRQKDIL